MAAGLHPGLIERVRELSSGGRQLLGIVGPPGSGKSTLARMLEQASSGRAQTVPMDGYHLAQVELERLGRASRKGAPDTFDAHGYAAILKRLRQQAPGEIIYAPDFRREIEEPVAGALPVFAATPLIITEGNYLLLAEEPWGAVGALLDEVWYLQVDADLRRERLALRHQQFGRSREEALAWVCSTDEPNAHRIEATRPCAHRQVTWDQARGLFC